MHHRGILQGQPGRFFPLEPSPASASLNTKEVREGDFLAISMKAPFVAAYIGLKGTWNRLLARQQGADQAALRRRSVNVRAAVVKSTMVYQNLAKRIRSLIRIEQLAPFPSPHAHLTGSFGLSASKPFSAPTPQISRWNGESCLLVHDHLGNSSHVGRNNRKSRSHGLHNHRRKIIHRAILCLSCASTYIRERSSGRLISPSVFGPVIETLLSSPSRAACFLKTLLERAVAGHLAFELSALQARTCLHQCQIPS